MVQVNIAERRTLSASRFHRDQYERTSPRGGSLLQRARHRRAVDQGRQVCLELDAAVLPTFCFESGEVGSVCLAYNLGNFLRRLVLPRRIKHWSLRTLLTKLIKIGAKVVRHSRIVTFQMAEVAVSEEVWAEILSRIDRLRWMTA